ncbi:hypothetical protein D3C77_106070 [compost metagenome]
MPIKGAEKVRANMAKVFAKIKGPMTQTTLTEVLIIGGGYADSMTPVDLGTLINSRFRVIKKDGDRWIARYGYTASYAAAVHALNAKLKGQPRADFGMTRAGQAFGGGSGKGNYWDPDAEPQWLEKGFERDGLADIKASIKRNMAL